MQVQLFCLTRWLQSNNPHLTLTSPIDYMLVAGAQAELFFWLTVEGYRVTAQQQLEVMEGWQKDGKKGGSTQGLLKAAALGVYEQYLSDKVTHTLSRHTHTLSQHAHKPTHFLQLLSTFFSLSFSLFPSLSLQASPRVQVDEVSVVKLREKLQKEGAPPPEIFDEIQRKVCFC